MRTFTICCLATGLLVQLGCAASIPSMSKLSMHRKPKPDPKTSADFVKAKDLERQGKFERARELYEQVVDKEPNNPEYLRRLAVICTRLQRYGEADDFFDRAYKRAPKDVNLVVDIGYSSYLRGDLEEAERWLREAVHLKPSDKRAVNNLALVVGVRGNTDECLSLLLEIDDKPTALCNLAYIHSQRGEYDLAEQRFREALAIDEKHKDATKGLAELSKLRPSQNVAIADTKSIEQETFKPLDFDATPKAVPPKVAPMVKQVSAVAENGNRDVLTANFEEEVDSKEPDLLDANAKTIARPVIAKVVTASFDDANDSDQNAPAEKPAAAARRQPVTDDDWDADPPARTKATNSASSSKTTSRESFDFDTSTDDSESETQPVAPVSAANGDQLKFTRTRPRPKIPAASDSNPPLVIESRSFE